MQKFTVKVPVETMTDDGPVGFEDAPRTELIALAGVIMNLDLQVQNVVTYALTPGTEDGSLDESEFEGYDISVDPTATKPTWATMVDGIWRFREPVAVMTQQTRDVLEAVTRRRFNPPKQSLRRAAEPCRDADAAPVCPPLATAAREAPRDARPGCRGRQHVLRRDAPEEGRHRRVLRPGL